MTEEKIAEIIWKDKWKKVPFDTKGYDAQTKFEWEQERKKVRYLARL